MPKKLIPVLATIGAAALLLAACSSGGGSGGSTKTVTVPGASASANEYMNSLYQKALKSGGTTIVAYGSSPSDAKPIWDAFSKRFPGITVSPQDQSDGQSLTKLQLEAKSGKRIGDMLFSGHSGMAPVAAESNICVAHPTIKTAAASDLKGYWDDKVINYTNRVFGLVYNTGMVKKSDVPTSWEDLLDSKWKGKIEMYDPTVLGGPRFIFADMQLPGSPMKSIADKIISGLAAQNPHVSSEEPAVATDVAAGRFPIGIGVYKGFYDSVKAKGSPVGFQFPMAEGNELITSGLCVVEDSPSYDASLLLTNWLFTSEGQKTIVDKTGAYAALPDAPGPAGMPPLKDVKVFPQIDGDQSQYDPYFAVVDKSFKH
jgi:ABC-type Fe3+ transport system, periplasmic component